MNSNPTNPNAKIGDEEFVKSKYPDAVVRIIVEGERWLSISSPTIAMDDLTSVFDSPELAWSAAASRLRAEEGIGEAKKCEACGAWICGTCLSCSSDCGCNEPDIPCGCWFQDQQVCDICQGNNSGADKADLPEAMNQSDEGKLPTVEESDAAMDSYLRDVGDMKAGKPTESAQPTKEIANLVIPSLDEYQAGQRKVHEVLGEYSPISGIMEVRQERDLAIKAVKAFMFCEQSNAGLNPHKEGTNRHVAFDLGMAVISMSCAEHVKLHKQPNHAVAAPSTPVSAPQEFEEWWAYMMTGSAMLNSEISKTLAKSAWNAGRAALSVEKVGQEETKK